MTVTLQDIATHLGVAKSTVSFTLRDHPKAQHFTVATRERILSAARELGYRPNFHAAQLAGKWPKLLMLCRRHTRDGWTSSVSDGFESRATQLGYRVLVATLHQGDDPLAFHRDMLGQQGAPAVAFLSSAELLTEEVMKELHDEGVRVVRVGKEMKDPRLISVTTDNRLGGELAAEHVYSDLDLNDVCVVATQGDVFRQRVDGFCKTAKSLGRPAPRLIEVPAGEAGIEAAQAIVAEAFRTGRPPQAVFAVSDALAVRAAHAMASTGRMTGRDVAVVGFNGDVYSTCHYPPLTTVVQPMAAMGAAAADLLITMLENPTSSVESVVIPPALRVQGSTQPFLRTSETSSDS